MESHPYPVIRAGRHDVTLYSATRFGDLASASRRAQLQRLFSTFPRAGPGVGLLLLRAALGLTVIFHSTAYFNSPLDPSPGNWMAALLGVAGGVFLLVGFLTPIASVVLALGSVGTALGWVAAPAGGLFDSNLALLNGLVTATALVLLGPGAFSLDARLFGRREIVIPSISSQPKS